MTPLRRRMIGDLELRGYSERTVEAYVRAVAQLARFYGRSPDRLTEEQVRDYLLHLARVQKVARGTHTIALCGIKFFYEKTLTRQWSVLGVARPKPEKKLPVVLSREEVWRILDQIRIDVYRVCLTTIYGCGLRLMEGARLQVADVDSARGFGDRVPPSHARALRGHPRLPHPRARRVALRLRRENPRHLTPTIVPGLSSTQIRAAATRGTNLYFVRWRHRRA